MVVDLGWGTKAEVYFNEYNHKTKKQVQVERTVTKAHESLINRQLDSTDCGTFLEERVGDVTLYGCFNLI